MDIIVVVIIVIVIFVIVGGFRRGDPTKKSDRPSPTGKTRKDSWPEPRRPASPRPASPQSTSQQPRSEQAVSTSPDESPQRASGGSEVPEGLAAAELSDADLRSAASHRDSRDVREGPAPQGSPVAPKPPAAHDHPVIPGVSPSSAPVYTGSSSFYTPTSVYTSSFSLTGDAVGTPSTTEDDESAAGAAGAAEAPEGVDDAGNEDSESTTP